MRIGNIDDAQAGFIVCGVLIGASYGSVDVALNLDGTSIEKATVRSLMPRMHGAYSIGAVIGAALGTAASAAAVPLLLQISALSALQAIVVVKALPAMPSGTGVAQHVRERVEHSGWLTVPVIALGICLLALTLGEGAAMDWLTLAVNKDYGASAAAAGAAFVVFNVAATATRLLAGPWVERWGRTRVLTLCAVIGANSPRVDRTAAK